VQEQAFFSSLMDCTIFAHQRVDFGYLESKPVLAGVATKLENLGLIVMTSSLDNFMPPMKWILMQRTLSG
jgi:hypothetical protein